MSDGQTNEDSAAHAGAVGEASATAAAAAAAATADAADAAGQGDGSARSADDAQHQGGGQGAATGQDDGQAGTARWQDTLGSDLAASPALKDVASVESLAKQFLDLQSHLGGSVRIPSEHASDEDKAAFRQKLIDKVPGLAVVDAGDPDAFAATMRQMGAPADASGYALPQLEGENLDPVEGFNEWAHAANLTQAQFDTIAKGFTAAEVAKREAMAVEHNAGMEALRGEWGFAYDQKMAGVANLAKLKGAPADMVTAIEAGRVAPAVLRFLSAVADSFGGDGMPSLGDQQQQEMTTSEANATYLEIMNNKQHDYWTALPGSAERTAAQELVMKLQERRMGKDSRAAAATFGLPDE